MTRLLTFICIFAMSLPISAQSAPKNSLPAIHLGERQAKFLRENPGCKKADSLRYRPAEISVRQMELFAVEPKTGIGSPARTNYLFYNKVLAAVAVEYEQVSDLNDILKALSARFGKYHSYITSRDIGSGAEYRAKETICWISGKDIVYFTYIPEIRFAQIVLADQILQDKSKSEIPKHSVKSL